jgi:outer membrane protein assembly factor BamB
MQNTEDNLKLISNLITASGIFCIAVALLLLINFIHIRTNKPLESEALKALVEQFQNDQQNQELKKEIRNLDLMARKAFFTSNWQVKTGSFLLLFGGILFAALLRIYHDMKAKIGAPLLTGGTTQITRLLSQRWVLITGGLLLGSALTASFLTTDYLKFYEETGQVVVRETKEQGERSKEEGERNKEEVRTVVVDSQIVNSESGIGNADTVNRESGIGNQDTVNRESGIGNQEVIAKAEATARHPNFRGKWGQGISTAVNIPVDWDGPSGRNIKWKATLDKKGYNSPIIWDNKLFIAGADAQSRVIYCYDRLTGALLWQHDAAGIPGSPATSPKTTSDTGLSAPSAATDGQRVYAIFANGDVVAVDFSGNRVWGRSLGIPDNHYGHSSSLLAWNNKLIVQFDTNASGKLLALDCATGNTIWEHPRKTKISWASPVLAELNGKLQILTVTSPMVYGNDFETGEELWSLECMSGEVGPSAAVYDGLVYAANEYATLACIQPGPTPKILWEASDYLPEAASPVAANGLLFIATSYGIFACYDAKTGTKYWEHEYGQGFYGSPMIADGKVYVMDRGGAMHIFKVDKTKTPLGDPVLGEKSVVTPAFADGWIYLRGERTLFGVGGV